MGWMIPFSNCLSILGAGLTTQIDLQFARQSNEGPRHDKGAWSIFQNGKIEEDRVSRSLNCLCLFKMAAIKEGQSQNVSDQHQVRDHYDETRNPWGVPRTLLEIIDCLWGAWWGTTFYRWGCLTTRTSYQEEWWILQPWNLQIQTGNIFCKILEYLCPLRINRRRALHSH